MNKKEAETYLKSKPEAAEEYPFGFDVQVFKVRGKMFALLSEEKGIANMNLKCDPDEALVLRQIYPAVLPGYHMNKRHWNTILLDGSLPPAEIERMIDQSYSLVVKGLPKAERENLVQLFGIDHIFKK